MKRFFPWKRFASKRSLGEAFNTDDYGEFGYDKRKRSDAEVVDIDNDDKRRKKKSA